MTQYGFGVLVKGDDSSAHATLTRLGFEPIQQELMSPMYAVKKTDCRNKTHYILEKACKSSNFF